MILCIGTTPTAQRSMTFDRLVLDEVNRAKEVSEYASGKSVNVAKVLKQLGQDPVATGFVGGPRGELIRRDLEGLGIRHEFVQVVPGTRLCTTVIDRSNGAATELVEESSEVEASAWPALDHVVGSVGKLARVWVMSGSLPPKGDVGAYERWTRMGIEAGATVIVDGRGEAVKRALPSGRFVLKLNREELAATVGMEIRNESELKQAMRRGWPEGGAVVVTMGKEGAAAYDGRAYWRVRTPGVEVVSPIGSGDAFAAGVAAGLHEGGRLEQAIKLGAACGAANAMTDRSGWVRREDVEAILEGTVVAEM